MSQKGLQWTEYQVAIYKDIQAGLTQLALKVKGYSGNSINKVQKAIKEDEVPDWVKEGKPGPAGTPSGDGQKPVLPKKLPQAASLGEAVRYRFVPKEFTIEASPIIFLALEAAVNLWGWSPNTRPGDFVDTIIYRYCKEHGVTLLEYAQKGQEEGGSGSPQ